MQKKRRETNVRQFKDLFPLSSIYSLTPTSTRRLLGCFRSSYLAILCFPAATALSSCSYQWTLRYSVMLLLRSPCSFGLSLRYSVMSLLLLISPPVIFGVRGFPTPDINCLMIWFPIVPVAALVSTLLSLPTHCPRFITLFLVACE